MKSIADQFRSLVSPPNNHLSPFQVTEGHCRWIRGDENDDGDDESSIPQIKKLII